MINYIGTSSFWRLPLCILIFALIGGCTSKQVKLNPVEHVLKYSNVTVKVFDESLDKYLDSYRYSWAPMVTTNISSFADILGAKVDEKIENIVKREDHIKLIVRILETEVPEFPSVFTEYSVRINYRFLNLSEEIISEISLRSTGVGKGLGATRFDVANKDAFQKNIDSFLTYIDTDFKKKWPHYLSSSMNKSYDNYHNSDHQVAKKYSAEMYSGNKYISSNMISDPYAQGKVALVIGNSNYATSPLLNPVNDAYDIATNLESCGFVVIKELNASKRKIEDAIDLFYKKLQHAQVGLFYYAGHAVQLEERNYLVPIDSRIISESDVKYETVNLGRILGKMKDAGSRLNIVLLDACRDNPFASYSRSFSRGLAKMNAPTGSIIIYSTAPGSVALDGEGRNGLYTSVFLQNMMIPGLSLEQMLKKTRRQVFDMTDGAQVPWESSSLMGEFYFISSNI